MIQCDMRPNHQTTYALAGIPLNLYYSTERDSKTILWPNDPRTHLGCGQLDFNPFSSGYFISTEQNNFDFYKGAQKSTWSSHYDHQYQSSQYVKYWSKGWIPLIKVIHLRQI